MGLTEKLYYGNLASQAEGMRRGLSDRSSRLSTLTSAFNTVVSSHDLTGEAADAMNSYISVVHIGFIQAFQTLIHTFENELSGYVSNYTGVDGSSSFQLVRSDMEAVIQAVDAASQAYASAALPLGGIYQTVEDIIYPEEAGETLTTLSTLLTVDFPTMKKIVQDELTGWSDYESTDYFATALSLVSELQAQVTRCQGAQVPSRPGEKIGYLAVPSFAAALREAQGYNHSAEAKANKNWGAISKTVAEAQAKAKAAATQKAKAAQMAKLQAAAVTKNRVNGFWTLAGGFVGAVFVGAALVLAPEVTVPLMVVAGTAGLMDASDMGEGLNQMITGKSKGANFIRDDVMRPVLGNKADLVYTLTDVSTNLVVPTGGLAELVKGSALVGKASAAKSLVVEKTTQTALKAGVNLRITSDIVKEGLTAGASKVVNGFQSAGERMAAGIGPQLSYAGATDGARVNLNFIQETQKTEKVMTSVGQETEKTTKSAISDKVGTESTIGNSVKTSEGHGLTGHGSYRANTRGFTSEKIDDIINNPSQKVYQSGGKTVYAQKGNGHYSVVIVNKAGDVITTVGGKTGTLKNWTDVTRMLNHQGGFSSLPYN